MKRVLGIETSCDETGVAIYERGRGIIGQALYSQIALHADYGGVVPELASRDHVRKALPLVKEAFRQAGLAYGDVDGVAYTAGPGLLGALLVGASLARSLAYGWGIPSVPVHHMEGHLLAPMLADDKPEYPFVALLVSGGHTQLIAVKEYGCYRLLGESVDDAVGEAFDKVAKMFGLAYPGGPEVAKWAEKGDANRFDFPRPMVDRPGLDFSFSGLKTSVLLKIRERGGNPEAAYSGGIGLDEETSADIMAGFQLAVVETLIIKCRRAINETGYRSLVVSGGVSANRLLRQRLTEDMKLQDVQTYYPPAVFCTDNGAMIALAGYQRFRHGAKDTDLAIRAIPRWPLVEV